MQSRKVNSKFFALFTFRSFLKVCFNSCTHIHMHTYINLSVFAKPQPPRPTFAFRTFFCCLIVGNAFLIHF